MFEQVSMNHLDMLFTHQTSQPIDGYDVVRTTKGETDWMKVCKFLTLNVTRGGNNTDMVACVSQCMGEFPDIFFAAAPAFIGYNLQNIHRRVVTEGIIFVGTST